MTQSSKRGLQAALISANLVALIGASTGQMPRRAGEVWVAVRTDNRPGKGTRADPYDGSTPAKFDTRIASLPPNIHLQLEAGTFRTAWNHEWKVKDGWLWTGRGIGATTIQMVGSLTGHRGVSAVVFEGLYDKNVSGFTATDFTIDCNWAGLANSAETGKAIRTFTTNRALNSATVVSNDGAFTQLDLGRVVIGAGLPRNTWIGVVNSAKSIGLSSSAVANVPVTATIAEGTTVTIAEKDCKAMAAYIYGANNCKFDRIRVIHGYGSITNARECFALGFAASAVSDAVNNVMTHCRVEEFYGNYASPYALGGFRGSPSYPRVVRWMTNSRVEFCSAVGRQGPVGYPIPGSATPFYSGGVNLADVKNCKVYQNRFEDCQGVAYQDTGGFDGVEVSDNIVIRGFAGIIFKISPTHFSDAVFRSLKITGNRLNIQRRCTKGANYGIVVANDCAPIINGNTITYDREGPGGDGFWPIAVNGTRGTIASNTVDGAEYVQIGDAGVLNGPPDSRYRVINNRTSDGKTVAGLADTAGEQEQ